MNHQDTKTRREPGMVSSETPYNRYAFLAALWLGGEALAADVSCVIKR